MPPKRGGSGGRRQGQNRINDISSQHPSTATADGHGLMAMSHASTTTTATKAFATTKTGLANQSKFTIAPLILEGVKLNKLELNDIIKKNLIDIRIADIQLSRTGVFTLYAIDVNSFNRLLNEFNTILSANGHTSSKIYVPRSIQRIKDTEKVAFVKRVDLEIPDSRIMDALNEVGLKVDNVIRLTGKDRNTPTGTIKITFHDAQNRNTFVQTGLQVDWMHFNAEPATQNIKPVQCFICLKFNHVAKYCKTNKQTCARCSEDHHINQCNAPQDTVKCCNCKGNHLANTADCPYYQDQENKIKKLVNQYSSTNKPQATPSIYSLDEFPSLPQSQHSQIGKLNNDVIEELVNIIMSKMEKMIEETTARIFKKLNLKIQKIDKYITTVDSKVSEESDDDSEEEVSEVMQYINNKRNERQQNAATSKTKKQDINLTTTTTTQTAKPKTKTTSKKPKRNLSPNSSLESASIDNKDPKTNNNNDQSMSH